jgi:hypothetical protein
MKICFGFFAALVLAFLSGCTSYPSDRIAAHQAEFNSWPPDVQAKVQAGIVGVGFTPEQVLVALGEPNSKTVIIDASGQTEVWLYHRSAPRLSIGVGGGSFNGSTAVAGGVSASGIKLGQDVGGQVLFMNGIVNQVRIMTH